MLISRPKSKKLVLDSMQIQMSTSMEYFISGIKNEKTVAVQKIKYHYKLDNGHSISKEDLSDKIKTRYTIQSPNQKLIDFI